MHTDQSFSFHNFRAKEALREKKSAELSEERIIAAKRVCGELMPRYGASRSWIFGSTLRKRALPDSDLDMMVEGTRPDLYYKLHAALEEKLNCTVDLHTDSEDPLFVKRIKERGLLIYEA